MSLHKILQTIIHIFYSIGVLFFATFLHELWHFKECGGGFIAGFYHHPTDWGFGATYCHFGTSGELIPCIIFSVVVLLGTFVKLKYDKML